MHVHRLVTKQLLIGSGPGAGMDWPDSWTDCLLELQHASLIKDQLLPMLNVMVRLPEKRNEQRHQPLQASERARATLEAIRTLQEHVKRLDLCRAAFRCLPLPRQSRCPCSTRPSCPLPPA